MSLENLNKMLKDAEDNNYAVPQFNVWNLEWISAVLDKCQELKTPVILGVSQNGAKYMGGFYVVTQMIKAYIKKNNITIPVAIHLDHASTRMADSIPTMGKAVRHCVHRLKSSFTRGCTIQLISLACSGLPKR